VVEAPPRTSPSEGGLACPHCRAPVEPGQLACLTCGARLGVTYRRPTGWRVPAAILAALILAAGAGTGFALSLLSSDPPRTLTTTAPGSGPAAAAPQGTPTPSTTPQGTAQAAPPPTAPPGPAGAALTPWPLDERAYTVVLSSSTDRTSAEREAQRAKGRGIGGVGVIEGRQHANLEPGAFLVYAGRQSSLSAAQRKAEGYASLGYGDAYPRLIEPKR
jgi:hypothetical protein